MKVQGNISVELRHRLTVQLREGETESGFLAAAVEREIERRESGGEVVVTERAPGRPSTAEKFLAAWNSADSPDEAAEALDVTRMAAQARAYRLRSQGHEVKAFGGQKKLPDLDDFVTAWNAAKSPAALAKRLGVSESRAKAKASELRSLGYEVKKFKTGGK